MLRRILFVLALGSLAAPPCAAGVAEQYLDAQLRAVASVEAQLDRLADVAELSCARLLAGGNIYLAGEKGMVSELLGRAGGLCAAKALSLDKPVALGSNDVVLLSDYGTPGKLEAALAKLVPGKALVIVFASAEQPALKSMRAENVRPVPVDIPLDSRLVTLAGDRRLIPAASPAIAAAEWAYVAELLAAGRREHRQLAVYLSVRLDPGRARFQRTKNLLFEPDLRPNPVPRGQYGGAFLARVRQSLLEIRGQSEAIRKAAVWIAEARSAGRKIVRNMHAHLPPLEVGIAGDVDFFSQMVRGLGPPGADWIRRNLDEGDLYLLVGYQQNEDDMAAAATERRARSIFLTSARPGPEQAANPRHLYINPHWPVTDGVLELPGYDVKACPLSAIANLSCYWAICAEAAADRTPTP